ncbi:DUF3179 domain-containing protein [Halorubrum sp. GN12_10-3_MGM]|uniref:DUF3179 domain-containing protein n=1 Tax=Halorubrum sp. GN12_10-3_MGM TaxID=2518113 RepID=UPI0010F55D5D|nr:DUF3179 domain-containing protein [Halorubrum sp. GN12_10-3_MGM]TKX64983.1 DUF3179 domain-containing protein [Halorubrum sp. GN12_10-3_MGM]
MVQIDRRTLLGALGVGISSVSGCLGLSDAGTESGSIDDGSDGSTGSTAEGPPTVERSLPAAYTAEELEAASRSGGPPPDGIPAIEDPQFAEATDPPALLDDGDPVFGVVLGGEAKAYPQSVLVWHEIVNDVIAGTPVSVTYCPLTGTAQGFHRGETTFGVSGQLINANLVMFDRATETWWPQMLATRITGDDPGEHLQEFRVVWTTWERWRSAHPETVVLTDDTGFARNYGSDPYGRYNPRSGYYAGDSFLFPPLTEDNRLAPKTVVIGMRSANGAVAVRKETLREERILDFDLGGVRHAAVYDESLDTGYVYRSRDGTESDGTDSADLETATLSWMDRDVVVDGTVHAPDSLPFEREIVFDAMWFAWYGYYPMTDLHR